MDLSSNYSSSLSLRPCEYFPWTTTAIDLFCMKNHLLLFAPKLNFTAFVWWFLFHILEETGKSQFLKHLPQATHDFVDIYRISFKLSLFWPEDSYCYYSVIPHVEDVSHLSPLYCSFPVFIYRFQKRTSTSSTDTTFNFSEWSSFSLLYSLEGILLLPDVLEEFSPGFDSFSICSHLVYLCFYIQYVRTHVTVYVLCPDTISSFWRVSYV